jgi:hypothetical protein
MLFLILVAKMVANNNIKNHLKHFHIPLNPGASLNTNDVTKRIHNNTPKNP